MLDRYDSGYSYVYHRNHEPNDDERKTRLFIKKREPVQIDKTLFKKGRYLH